MFQLNEKYEVNRSFLNCDYIRFSPSEISARNTANFQISINIRCKDSVTSLLNSYLDVNLDVIEAATGNRYAHGNDIRLVDLGPIVLFSSCKLTTSSGIHLENISHAHTVSLLYKLITSAKDTDELSFGFDRDRVRRQRELTNIKNIISIYKMKIMLRDNFGFGEAQEKCIYGLGFKITLTRISNSSVLNKANATNNDKIKKNGIEWYIPHFTPSIAQQAILSMEIFEKVPTQLEYVERFVFMKEVNTQNLWSFELGTQETKNVPMWIFISFQQSDRQDSQNLNYRCMDF